MSRPPLPGARGIQHYALALARRAGRDLRATWPLLGRRVPESKPRRPSGKPRG